MPLEHSASDEARSRNIATEVRHGKDPKQVAAIAYSVQREAQGKSSDDVAVGRPMASVGEMIGKGMLFAKVFTDHLNLQRHGG